MKAFWKNDQKKVWAGVVKKFSSFTKEGVKKVAIDLQNYKEEVMTFYFTNNESVEPKQMRADAVERQYLKEGDFCLVFGYAQDEDATTATGIQVKKKGRFSFVNGTTETTIVIGTACRPQTPKEGMFRVSMALPDKDESGEFVDRWYDITFFDGSKEDASAPTGKVEWKNAEYAAKVMGGLEKAPVAVVCSGIKTREYNGKMYYSLIGFQMTRKP